MGDRDGLGSELTELIAMDWHEGPLHQSTERFSLML